MHVNIDEAGNNRLMLQVETQIAGRRAQELPATTSRMRSPSSTTAPGLRMRSGRTTCALARTIMPAARCRSVHTSLRPSSGLGALRSAAEERLVGVLQEPAQPAFVGRGKHDHAGALDRREPAIVGVVAIERDRASARAAVRADSAGCQAPAADLRARGRTARPIQA